MAIIWGSAAKKVLKILERCTRSSARVILNLNKYDQVKFDMYDKLKWFLPYDMYLYQSACLIYQILHESCSPYFLGSIKYYNKTHMHETRIKISEYNVNIDNIQRNAYGRKSLMFKAASEWNFLPNEIVSSTSLNCFKAKMTSHIINVGKSNCK